MVDVQMNSEGCRMFAAYLMQMILSTSSAQYVNKSCSLL